MADIVLSKYLRKNWNVLNLNSDIVLVFDNVVDNFFFEKLTKIWEEQDELWQLKSEKAAEFKYAVPNSGNRIVNTVNNCQEILETWRK